jgi:hypothetical protein
MVSCEPYRAQIKDLRSTWFWDCSP